jgi:hypothetical protein
MTRLAATVWTLGAALLVASTLLLAASEADGRGRDSDGSRMQARKVSLGSKHSDSLSPPDDRVDWRYFKLDEARSVTVSLRASPEDVPVGLVVTSATGSKLGSETSSNGKAAVSRSLQPGLYYVGVSSKKAAKYRISFE